MADLIFHQGALGDWVLTFGLMRAMGGPVTAVAGWSKAQLAAHVLPSVEPMDVELREFTRLFADGGPAFTSPAVAEMFAQARRIVSFVSRGDDAWATNVRRLAPEVQIVFVFPRPPVDFAGHVWRWHAEQLETQGMTIAQSTAPARRNPTGPIVLHPGSGGEAKCWPTARFAALAKGLRDEGYAVKALIGEAEVERWPAAAIDSLREVCEVVAPRSLVELSQVVEQARVFIGNDAGPTHLAADLGVPTIALFGPSDAAQWSPRGPLVTVMKPAKPTSMDWLSVAAVEDSVRRMLV